MWILDQLVGRGIEAALISARADRDSGTRTEPRTQTTPHPITASSGEEH
ncbi:hypothetical protein ACWEOH_05760 [Agromyces sp. NPDC004153]